MKFEPPVSNTVSLSIPLKQGQSIENSIGEALNGQGISLCDAEIIASITTARENGGRVLYATTSIEKKLEGILDKYFMEAYPYPNDKRELFNKEILQSPALGLNFKKEVIQKIFNQTNTLKGKEKNDFQRSMSDIVKWRNAFAHGSIAHDVDNNHNKKCLLKYYSGSNKVQELDDSFWVSLMFSFTECNALLDKANETLRNAK